MLYVYVIITMFSILSDRSDVSLFSRDIHNSKQVICFQFTFLCAYQAHSISDQGNVIKYYMHVLRDVKMTYSIVPKKN